jgi:hypothetical protein
MSIFGVFFAFIVFVKSIRVLSSAASFILSWKKVDFLKIRGKAAARGCNFGKTVASRLLPPL